MPATVNPDREREEALFEAARQLRSPSDRAAFLNQACADDPALRERLGQLLLTEPAAAEFFAAGAPDLRLRMTAQLATPLPKAAVIDEQIGSRIGPYKLLQRIGEGGCGIVYMADQEEPIRRRVALKIIKLGMDTKSVIARFEAERQALAMMDHPNIARVLDAGATDTGRPYFVMELVRGVKITEYCDQNQLDTRHRLDLFCRICHAIQHAHQKGIIHRDIKPSNVLVTMHDGVPVPKVIDFGIAKAIEQRLTDKTLFTAYEQLIGTPAYMSPEQAEMSGLDVDTRSDIYSLGVLLYELLTGRTPFDSKELMKSGMEEMRRTLREREPERPSVRLNTLQGDELTATAIHRHVEPPKLISQMRGDLDWIVMKALEKDRTRRYETANGLAMDIQRHLNNEPVAARPPSRLYRLQKLVRRNKVVFAAGATVTLVVLLGLATSIWLLLREREARHRAVAAERQQALLRIEAERGRKVEMELRSQAEMREKITQAAALISQERNEEADRLISQLPLDQTTMEGATVFRTLGNWNAIHEQWHAAKDRFSMLRRASRLDDPGFTSLDSTRSAVALVECGDREEYECFSRETIKRFETTADPVVAERTVKNCLLLPPSDEVMNSLGSLAQLTRKSLVGTDFTAGETGWQTPWRCLSLALLEYRLGNSSESIVWSRRCLGFGEHPLPRSSAARAVLAMSLHRLGDATEARAELAKARATHETSFKSGMVLGDDADGYWFDWVLSRILLREAATLLGKNSH